MPRASRFWRRRGGRWRRRRCRGRTRSMCGSSGRPIPPKRCYGMGQMQLGVTNIKDWDLDFWQHNGTMVVPFMVSSKGYGIFWDNTSYTRFGDLGAFGPIPPACLVDDSGDTGRSVHGDVYVVRRTPGRIRRPADHWPGRRRTGAGRGGQRPRRRRGGTALGGQARADRDGRLPVPGVLQRDDPGLDRRQAGDGSLPAELAAVV